MKSLRTLTIAAGAALTGLTAGTALAAGQATLQGAVFTVDTVSHYTVGPGLTQTSLVFKNGSRYFNAFVLDLNTVEGGDAMRVKVDVGRDSCNTAEAITSIAKRKTNATTQYLGGINGDFFITSSFAAQHEFGNAILGYPNMSCATEGKLVAPDIIDYTSRENALVIGSDGMWIDATNLKYRLLDNSGATVVDATAVNYPRRDEEMVIYNSYMGKYTKTSPTGREIVLRMADGATWNINKTTKFVVDGDWHSGQSRIPEDGLVISCGAKYSNAFIDGLRQGDIVKMKIVLSLPAFGNLKPDVKEICGGDVRILNENVTTTQANRWINSPSAKYSRSLVGYSQDRTHVVMCAVDASTSGSSGVTYYEAADVMRALGCWDALDLDGGGSTAIWSHSHGIINNLRDGSERAVGNGLFFVLDAPRGTEHKSIRFADHTIKLPRYGMYRPVIFAYNEQGQLVEKDLKDFTLEAPEQMGTVTADGCGVLVTGTGSHILTARSGDMTADITVEIADAAQATPRVASYLLNGYHDTYIVLEAPVGDKMMEVAAQAYQWTVADPSVVTVAADGKMTGLKNGTTVVTGTLGSHTIEIPVTVERPGSNAISMFSTWNPDDWIVTKTSVSTATLTAVEGGMDVNYNVSSTRGPRVTLKNETAMYSLPDGVEVTYSQDNNAMSSVVLNIQPANETRTLSVTATEGLPAAGVQGTARFDLSAAMDLKDPAVYPVKFVSLTFNTAGKTGANTLKIRGIDNTYSYVESSVDNITVPEVIAEKLILTAAGNTLQLPFTADNIEIFTPAGAKVAHATHTDCVDVTPGSLYIVRATLGAKTLSTRILVK